MATLDTKTAARRSLRFETVAEALADAEALMAAEAAGTLRATGNWTLGQALGHVAGWASFPYEGYPPEMKPPWVVRAAGRVFKGKLLRGPMPAGFSIPRVPGGTWATEVLATSEGFARLQRALERLEREPPTVPNPVFGALTHEQWKRLNLGHAELHQSFFHPE